jgi:hypothetical protein
VKVENGTVFVDLDRPAVPANSPLDVTPSHQGRVAEKTESVVIVGAGQAAAAAIQALRANAFAGPISLVGSERHLPYVRPPLSKDLFLGTAEPSACTRLQAHHRPDAFGARALQWLFRDRSRPIVRTVPGASPDDGHLDRLCPWTIVLWWHHPLVASYLVAQTGSPTSPGLFLTGVIFLSILCLWGCRRLDVR